MMEDIGFKKPILVSHRQNRRQELLGVYLPVLCCHTPVTDMDKLSALLGDTCFSLKLQVEMRINSKLVFRT